MCRIIIDDNLINKSMMCCYQEQTLNRVIFLNYLRSFFLFIIETFIDRKSSCKLEIVSILANKAR